MLGTLRKYSSSIAAKIFLFVVAIPFVFWGMGDMFSGGNQNTIVKIDNQKISVEEFVNYLQNNIPVTAKINENLIEEMFSRFIGSKLIEEEIKKFNIKLPDESLSKIIKNEKVFKRNNIFSRTEYEKFLVTNSLNAAHFEKNMSDQVKKKKLLDFIGGGIFPSNFLVDLDFNKINQKRHVQLIKLDNIIKKIKISDKEILKYFNDNKDNFKVTFRTIKFIELNPKNLMGNDEFSDLFFKKIDEIDDLIVNGKKLNFISKKFDLDFFSEISINKKGESAKDKKIEDFPNELIESIFSIKPSDPTVLIAHKNEYFIVELIKTEELQKKITDESVKKNILTNLENQKKRKFISELISKIGSNNLNKLEFDELSEKENIKIQKITFQNQNDDKIFKKNLIAQIYKYPENKVIVIADIGLSESYLVYIDKIENVNVEKDSKNYKDQFNLTKIKMINNLYNTYDSYLKNKYEIEINYKVLDRVKNNIQ